MGLRFLVNMAVVLILTISTIVAAVPTTLKGTEGNRLPRFTKEPKSVRALPGATIRSVCEGYFGDFTLTTVDWVPLNEEVYNYINEPENFKRFNISKYEGGDGIKGAILTVENVTRADYNITMVCILFSSDVNSHMTMRNFTILPPLPVTVIREDLGEIIVLVVAGIVVTFLVVVVLIIHFFGPQFYLCLYSRCPFVRPSSNENFRYDTIVIHDQTDNEFTLQHIKPYFEGLPDLNVEYVGQSLLPGVSLFEGIQELIRESFCVMFVITPDVNPALFRHLLEAAKEMKRTLLVIKAHPEGLHLNRWQQQDNYDNGLRDLQKTHLTYLLTITWPGNDAPARKRKNFWCTVRKQLPFPSRSSAEV